MILHTQGKRFFSWTLLGLFLLAVVLPSMPVRADIMLQTDNNAVLHGYNDFYKSNSDGTKIIAGHIDYAVYAPAQFSQSFSNADSSTLSNFVYAYQIFSSSSSSDYIKTLSVGLAGDEQTVFTGWLGGTSGVAPSANNFSGTPRTSDVWNFNTTRITHDTNSEILYFTSPFGPDPLEYRATLAAGTVAANWTGTLPNPAPEPATLSVLALSGGLFLLVRVFQHKLLI